MANPTTNYGFVLPTATDLVTDLPADFDVALQGVDTRLKALQPGTTTGDLAYSSATANTNTRLGIGSTSQVLTVAGGVPTWATPAAGGGMTQIATGTLSGASVVISSIPATYKDLNLVIRGLRPSTDGEYTKLRLNGDSSALYNPQTADQGDGINPSDTFLQIDRMPDNTVTKAFHNITFFDYTNTSTIKVGFSYAIVPDSTTSTNYNYTNRSLFYNSTSAISSITLFPSAGNWAAGTYILYGVS